jgi:phosphopantothenoylcysteine synthetase/decarboxylase
LILCAAVSDFIPSIVSEHKIQTQEKLQLSFISPPKILGQLVDNRHLTISFKL